MNPPLWFPHVLQRSIWIPIRILFFVFLRWRIEGIEHVRNTPRGIVLSVNHTSEFDPVLTAAAFPFLSPHIPLFYVSRSPNHYRHLGWRSFFYGGFLFKLWGSYPAESGTQDYEQSLSAHVALLLKRKTICIFPYGKIKRDHETPKIHGGVAYLSWKTGKPIIPVHIEGADGLTLSTLLAGKHRVVITFKKPVSPIELFGRFNNTPVINATRNDFRSAAETLPA